MDVVVNLDKGKIRDVPRKEVRLNWRREGKCS